MRFPALRGMAPGLIVGALFITSATASADTSGMVVGRVTCGDDEATSASHVAVVIDGVNVQTLTDDYGYFTLSNVPTDQRLRIMAISDTQPAVTVSHAAVVVAPGQALDIGSMDLALCGPATQPQYNQDVQATEH